MRDSLMSLRGERDMYRREIASLRRSYLRMRRALLHDCPICRLAWCTERERLVREALGRQWLTTQVPE